MIKWISNLTHTVFSLENMPIFIATAVFSVWLVYSSCGKNALQNSKPRRNSMPFYMPFIPMLMWFILAAVSSSLINYKFTNLSGLNIAITENISVIISGFLTSAFIFFLVKKYFQRGLKGFGLDFKTVFKDIVFAVLNLFTAWPIILVALIATTYIGKLILGSDFELAQHSELKLVSTYPNLSIKILVCIVAIVVAPIVEELIFRGMFQNLIRSILTNLKSLRRKSLLLPNSEDLNISQSDHALSLGAWTAVFCTAAIFAAIHANPAHWPTLFVLSCCLGYSYEKSGSLIRPIIIHSLFNATSVIAVIVNNQ